MYNSNFSKKIYSQANNIEMFNNFYKLGISSENMMPCSVTK